MKNGLPVAEMDFEELIGHEWLAANGIGGYASSTAASLNTRRYHGLLVAAMAPPVRRMVLLSRLEEAVRIDGREAWLACNEYPGTIWPRGHEFLRPSPASRSRAGLTRATAGPFSSSCACSAVKTPWSSAIPSSAATGPSIWNCGRCWRCGASTN